MAPSFFSHQQQRMLFIFGRPETRKQNTQILHLLDDKEDTTATRLNNIQAETFTAPNTRHALFYHLTAVSWRMQLPHCEFHSALSLFLTGYYERPNIKKLSLDSGDRKEISPQVSDRLI